MADKLSSRYQCASMFCSNKHSMIVAIQIKTKEKNFGYTTQWLCHDCAHTHIVGVVNQVNEHKAKEKEARKKK